MRLKSTWFGLNWNCVVTSSRHRNRDENGSDMNGYHWYYICFHISVRIRIWIWIVSTMPDRIRLDIDIINMRFQYSETGTVSDIEYPNSDMDKWTPLNGFGLEYGQKISVPFSSLHSNRKKKVEKRKMSINSFKEYMPIDRVKPHWEKIVISNK
jgi:hypothetical protein